MHVRDENTQMSGLRVFVGSFGLIALAVSLWAVWRTVKSPQMRYKPLWIVGSLFGFAGFSMNWSSPGHLFMLVGIQIPVVIAFKVVGTGYVFVKTMFPLIAVVALVKSDTAQGQDVG